MEDNNLKRRVQVVSTKPQRKRVINWMITAVQECETESYIVPKAVEQFPLIFTQRSPKTNREKSRRWWKERENFIQLLSETKNEQLHVVRRRISDPGARRCAIKPLSGRRRKREP